MQSRPPSPRLFGYIRLWLMGYRVLIGRGLGGCFIDFVLRLVVMSPFASCYYLVFGIFIIPFLPFFLAYPMAWAVPLLSPFQYAIIYSAWSIIILFLMIGADFLLYSS